MTDTLAVLFRDYWTDLYAKGSFSESHAPCAAVYMCVDAERQHYLWKLHEPTVAGPSLEKISAAEAQANGFAQGDAPVGALPEAEVADNILQTQSPGT